MTNEIKLQALKEGVAEVEVDQVKVTEGDVVSRDQVVLVVQADKAALEVTAPAAGRIARLLVRPGDLLKVGQPYLVLEERPVETPVLSPKPEPTREPAVVRQEVTKEPDPADRRAVAPVVAALSGGNNADPSEPKLGNDVVLAGPATRRLARELGVELGRVRGTGPKQRVTPDDLKAYVRALASGAGPTSAAPPPLAPPLPRFEDWGPVERQRLDAIRKQTAKQMALAWSLIPHVTQHDLADITDLDAFRRQEEGKGPKLTVTAFALKAVAVALRQFPAFNASIDLAGGQLVLKGYYHIGVAVDTERGLLVPVLRDVDRKSVLELARELGEIADWARQGKLSPEEMRGGTFTVTNLGGIGGVGFTPIVNWPEVAILGLSRARQEPVVRDGQVVPRLVLPLSLSYDHRVIDGAAAARFTRRVAEMLENPWVMLLHA